MSDHFSYADRRLHEEHLDAIGEDEDLSVLDEDDEVNKLPRTSGKDGINCVEKTKRRSTFGSKRSGSLIISGIQTGNRGSFSKFLAPLTDQTFEHVVCDVENKLEVVNETLSMLDIYKNNNGGGFESALEEMLEAISLKIGELLRADRTTIYLLDEEKDELWSKVAKGMPELRFPSSVGIAGEVAHSRKVINIPFDFYDDPRSVTSKKFDQKSGYRTYTMLVMPLLDEVGDLLAVVQMINKVTPNVSESFALFDRIDLKGFTEDDEELFDEFSRSIRLILESTQVFYKAMQEQRAANAMKIATEGLRNSSLDLSETLKNVMDQARLLMSADRSTLWLLDNEKEELWTKIPIGNESREIRVPSTGSSFASQVSQSGKPLLIPFDLYNHKDSETSKETDKATGYRTCSMLCMPVFNSDRELIGVTQLINKQRQGEYSDYDPESWPAVPDRWRSSFNLADQEFMETFNIQAGVALQNAKLFQDVKQQEQMQKDILRSLSDGVISVDGNGDVIAANESAKKLVGLPQTFQLKGYNITEVLKIHDQEGNNVDKLGIWISAALEQGGSGIRQQYYPDQIILPSPLVLPKEVDDSEGEEKICERSVNLSFNTMVNTVDKSKVRGAVVVMEDISDAKRLKNTMYRYMSQDLAEQLLANGDAYLGGDRKDVSVLFSDIRGYTTITEKMDPEEVVSMLNEYFESMVDAVFAHKGTLDKYIGDAIMAVFGSPLALEDHAWMTVLTAVDMRHRLVQFNDTQRALGKQEIMVGIGVHSDEVVSGNIGSSKRMEYTAIGDGVNLASRLEGATKNYGVDTLISHNTVIKCGIDRLVVRELDFIKVKGKTEPVAVYELVGVTEGELFREIPPEKLESMNIYKEGRDHYIKRNFALAAHSFARCLEISSTDKAAELHLVRCQHYLVNPPSADWDGAFVMTSK